MNIQNSVFIVTGGASGLGGATAQLLADRGGRVVIADVNAETGAAHAASIGERARFVRTDVSDAAAMQAAIDAAMQAFGGLHGVVNAAGIGTAEKVLGREGPHTLESFTRTIRINLIGAFN